MSKDNIKGQRQRNYQRSRAIRSELKAGGCVICGYNRCVDALDFHHVSGDKESAVSSLSANRIRLEAAKCIVVCSNCHREIHSGQHHDYGSIRRSIISDNDLPILRLIQA